MLGAASAAVGLAGCGSTRRLEALYDGVMLAYKGPTAEPMNADYVRSLPFASMSARYLGFPRALVVLAEARPNGDQSWLSGQRELIVTRHGRLMKTVGLVQNLAGTQLVDSRVDNALGAVTGGDDTESVDRFIDIAPDNLFGLAVHSSSTVLPNSEIHTILDLQFELEHRVEHCRVDDIDWRFDNHFWFSTTTGELLKSHQYVAPKIPPIELEIYKTFNA